MDIEDLLADDGQFKDENLDDIDEMALLGSSEDEDEISGGSSIQNIASSYYKEGTSKSKISDSLEDESDVLEVNVDADLDTFIPDNTKDDDLSPDVSIPKYEDNLISVRVSNPSMRNDTNETPSKSKRYIKDNIDKPPIHVAESSDVTDMLDEESDDENMDNDRRGRFKSERATLHISTSSKNKYEIPDSLDSVLSVEETQKVNSYLENQQRRKMFQRQRGHFRGKNSQKMLKSGLSTGSMLSENINKSGPTKIHVNPHFRQNPDVSTGNMHSSAPATFSQNILPTISGSPNYTPIATQPTYDYNNTNYTYSETNRYSTAQLSHTMTTGPIAPSIPYQSAPLPNLQVPPPSNILQSNYMQPSSSDYPISNIPPTSHQVINPEIIRSFILYELIRKNPAMPNIWVPPPNHVQVSPLQVVDSSIPNFTYSGTSGYTQPAPPTHLDNSYGNYHDPTRQPVDGHASHNLYVVEPPTWFPNQTLPPPPVSTGTSFSQNLDNSQISPQSMSSQQYQNSGPNYSRNMENLNEQKRLNHNLPRKIIKRSGNNISANNMPMKKYRYDDNQRKILNLSQANSNIKQIPLIENLQIGKSYGKSYGKSKSVEDEDEETQEYRRKVEQQKLIREAFLRRKEERRKMQAVQMSMELKNKSTPTKTNSNNVVLTKPTVGKASENIQTFTQSPGKRTILWKNQPLMNASLNSAVKTLTPVNTSHQPVQKLVPAIKNEVQKQTRNLTTQGPSVQNTSQKQNVGGQRMLQQNIPVQKAFQNQASVEKVVQKPNFPIQRIMQNSKQASNVSTQRAMQQPNTSLQKLMQQPNTPVQRLMQKPYSSTQRPMQKLNTPAQRPMQKPYTPAQRPMQKPYTPAQRPMQKPYTPAQRPMQKPYTSAQRPMQQPNTFEQKPIQNLDASAQRPLPTPNVSAESPIQKPNVPAEKSGQKPNILGQTNTQIVNTSVQKQNVTEQTSSSQQVTKIDLRNKIANKSNADPKQIIKIPSSTQLNMKSLSQKNKIRFGVSQPVAAMKKKAMMTLATAAARGNNKHQTIKLNTGKVIKVSNVAPRFRRPFLQQRALQNRNPPNPIMFLNNNALPRNRFTSPPPFINPPLRPETSPPMPFPPNMIRNTMMPNPRFNFEPRMPFVPFHDNRMPFFQDQPPRPRLQPPQQANMMFERPPVNFNRPPPFIRPPENFFMDQPRMPPPSPQRFSRPPSQVFHPPPPQIFHPPREQFSPNRMPMQRYRPHINHRMNRNPFNNRQKKQSPNSQKPATKAPKPVTLKEATSPVTSKEIVKPKPKLEVCKAEVTSTSEKPIPDVNSTCTTVIVSNLSSSTSEVQLKKLSNSIGKIKSIKHVSGERKAVIEFCKAQDAVQFQSKYQRFMMDLSLIEIKFQNA